MAQLAILISEHMLDLTASRLRDEGVAFTLVPPCTLKLECDSTSCDHFAFLPGLSPPTCVKVVAALLGVTSLHLTNTLLPRADPIASVVYPFDSVTDGQNGKGHFVIHAAIPSILFNVCACPETHPCILGQGKGGPWILFHAAERGDGFDLQPLSLVDEELLPKATAIMSRAAGY